jgi:hypothetical protein
MAVQRSPGQFLSADSLSGGEHFKLIEGVRIDKPSVVQSVDRMLTCRR